MNHQQTKCPNCGAEWNTPWGMWKCGTFQGSTKLSVSELCAQRSECQTWHRHYRDSFVQLQKWKQSWFDLDEKRQKLKAEVERLKKPRYPFESFDQFCSFLTSTNLIDELAVSDPDGWDGGVELSRIEKAFDQYLEETNK